MDIDSRPLPANKLFPSRFYDSYFVNEYGRIEEKRATRYNTCFSIAVVNIDGFGPGALLDDPAGAEFLRKLAGAVVESVRSCDIPGLLDGRRIIVILPETDYFGSLMTVRKLGRALGPLLKPERGGAIVFSHATFPRDGRNFGELLEAALKRAEARKESPWERLNLRGKLFWEILGELSGGGYHGFESASFDAGTGQGLTEFFIDQINELIIKEISRSPQRRGIMYYAAKSISAGLPVVKNLSAAGATATKVFLVGEGGGGVWDIRNAVPLLLDDPRLRETFFTFFLNEDSAYALVCKENWGATFSCFHTAEPALVEGLITKFQNEYSLQEQLG